MNINEVGHSLEYNLLLLSISFANQCKAQYTFVTFIGNEATTQLQNKTETFPNISSETSEPQNHPVAENKSSKVTPCITVTN